MTKILIIQCIYQDVKTEVVSDYTCDEAISKTTRVGTDDFITIPSEEVLLATCPIRE